MLFATVTVLWKIKDREIRDLRFRGVEHLEFHLKSR